MAAVRRGERLLMRRRPADEEIMPGFWEMPQAIGDETALRDIGLQLGERLGTFRHGITTRSFRGVVCVASLETRKPEEYRWISAQQCTELPITTITKKALLILAETSGAG